MARVEEEASISLLKLKSPLVLPISIGNRVVSYLGSKREGYIICKDSEEEEEEVRGESGSAFGDALWSISMSMRKDGVGRSLTRVNADATGNIR